MERLTNIGSNGEIWITDNDETRRFGRKESAYKKLAEYEDLEEQGLLLRLPCKVGDTVYALRYGEENDFIIVETKIIEIRQNMNGIFFEPLISRKAYKTEDFGKEVFLTQAEAEQKLKQMESD